jgi:hypothetical protein
MLAQDSPYGDWPSSGEIDILEAINLDGLPGPGNFGGGNVIFSAIHFGGGALGRLNDGELYTPSTDVTEDFHTYAIEWDEFEIRWYFDGILWAVKNSWESDAAPYPAPFDQPFHVLLNLAVGGVFPGEPDGSTPFPAEMEVDWVRVYSGEGPPPIVTPPADHGPGTAGVFTETTTESPITVTSITNSIDFGGNNTVADPNSMAIPAFEGDVVMSIDYQDSGSTFGGVVLNFGGVDLTAYDTLNVTVDTSGIAGFADLTIQIEPPGAGAAGTNVLLSSYTPVATSGNWATYAIPLADFTATDFTAAANLGFWNPTDGAGLAFGTLYVDDVYFSTAGGGSGALVPDGGFEAAGVAGLQPPWFIFENGGTVSVSDLNSNGGTYAARLQADASSGVASFPILKVERLGTGSFTGGEPVTVSFDVIDVDNAGAGKVFVAELFTERSDPPGGATNEVLLGGYGLTGAWQTLTFNTNLGADAAGGVSLLFKADCGANPACTMDVFIDNVSIEVN